MRRVFSLCATILIALLAALPAFGQQALQVRIRETALDKNGFVRLIVSLSGNAVTGVFPAEAFGVTEAGHPVEGVKVEPLLDSRVQPVAVVLVMDVSGSTKGQPLSDAKAAAKAFVAQLPQGVRVAIVSFGALAEVKSEFTTNREALLVTVDSLNAGGETSLYDGVNLAAQLLSSVQAQRNMLVFSDGKDTVSKSTFDSAVAAAREVKSPINTIGLVTPDYDPAALDGLATQTEGRSIPVEASGDLLKAFSQVARELASQYVLTYTARTQGPKELDITVNIATADAMAADTVTVLNPRVTPAPDLPRVEAPTGLLTTVTGLYLGAAATFIGLALLTWVVISRPRLGAGAKVLKKGLALYSKGGKRETSSGMINTAIGKRMVEFVDNAPKPGGYDQKLQIQLERAGWPLRSSEYVVLQAALALSSGFVGFGLFGKLWMGLLMPIVALYSMRFVLRRRIERRSSAFLSQLPDTLQLLAGSLQAGYGLLQAIDTVTKESPAPTSVEFSRVLSEARLGMALEDAMNNMAERVGSEDFRWVVIAINIQRQVGGNLAQLLETVANTLREREQLRRQVKVLSAEGRLSAWILTILPFALALYLALVNPSYLGELFARSIGIFMIVIGGVFMGAGILWMRKIVKIEV